MTTSLHMAGIRAIPVAVHDNQCEQCGAFRTDGYPPTVHFTRCLNGPDGMRVGAIGENRPARKHSNRGGWDS